MGKYCRVSQAPSGASAATRAHSFVLRVARGKQVKDAVSEVCSAHELAETGMRAERVSPGFGRTQRCAAHRRPERLVILPIPLWRAAKGTAAPSPSPALWSPGRRGQIPSAAASTSFRWIAVGQAVHNSSCGVDMPDSFKSRAEVYDHSNSSYTHALCGCRRAERGRVDVVEAHEGAMSGPELNRSRDHQQRQACLRGSTIQPRHGRQAAQDPDIHSGQQKSGRNEVADLL